MADDSEALHRVELALTGLTEKVTALVTRMDSMEKSRDKDLAQITALLAPRLDALDKTQERQAAETAGLGIRVNNDMQVMENRLGIRIDQHLREPAPHDETIGHRIGKLENASARLSGALAVLAIFSPVLAAFLTKYLGG